MLAWRNRSSTRRWSGLLDHASAVNASSLGPHPPARGHRPRSAFAQGSICRQPESGDTPPGRRKADLRGCGRSPPPLGCRPRRQARQHRLAGAPSPAPLETAPPATVRWSPEAPPTPGPRDSPQHMGIGDRHRLIGSGRSLGGGVSFRPAAWLVPQATARRCCWAWSRCC